MEDIDMALLSPEYEETYARRYGRQPKYIPVDFKYNIDLPAGVEIKTQYSRMWIKNDSARGTN